MRQLFRPPFVLVVLALAVMGMIVMAAPDRPHPAASAPLRAAAMGTAGLPEWQHTSVNDFAALLSADDARALDEALIALHRETGVQGTVVTIPDRATYGDASSIENFATRLFNRWGVGDAQRNDGFMVLVSRGDREARIELGSGYGPEADLLAQDVMRRVMLPSLREGDLSRALRDGTLAVIDRIARPHAAGQRLARPDPSNERSGRWSGLATFLAMAAGMFGLQRWHLRRRNRCPKCGHQGLDTTGTPQREDLPDGGWRTRMQTSTRRCPSCGWEESRTVPLPVITYYDREGNRNRVEPLRGMGKGSSGFGGGSSRGGGASGRW